MSKSYWHSVGSGALGVGGPWNSQSRRDRWRTTPLRGFIGQIVLVSLLVALLAGMTIGVFQTVGSDVSNPLQTAAVAYQSVGLTIQGSFAGIMTLLSLGDYAAALQDNVLFYLEIPYQLCAFAGAYITTAVIQLLAHAVAMAASYR